MKQLTIVLIIAVAALATGCQDSNMTAPSVNSSSHIQLDKPAPQTGTTTLKASVMASGAAYSVTGEVSYEYRIVGDAGSPTIEFSISTHADLVPANPILPSGAGSDQSIYSIDLASKTGVIYTQRDCFIPELDTKLHVMLAIAEDNTFSVESIWIDQVVPGPERASSK